MEEVMAKILFITSSWRKGSNSSCLAAHAVEGAKSNGHTVTVVDIAQLHIGPCRACMACHKNKNGRCVQHDDMTQFYPPLEEADVLIFASPVYWFNLCGQIKQFIDRCYALAAKEMPDGKTYFSRKKIGVVLAHEGNDPFDSGGINAIRSIQDICSYTGANFVGALYGSANNEGEVADNAALLKKARAYGIAL